MSSESYLVGLGNDDSETRKKASSDFTSFWASQAKNLHWFEEWKSTLQWDAPFAKWFVGGKLNASYNTLDVHQQKRATKPAILWEGENNDRQVLTYNDLWIQVNKFANVLKSLGVTKGDRVTIYLPMVPELIIAMNACARIGATHTVVFSGFSARSLRDRIEDSKSKVIITADGGFRRGTVVKLKQVIDDAIQGFDFVQHVIVLERTKIP
ncbi:MAG TPA: AMP-binding protein, partial [Nitrosopumilaceae archaeon]|nr:AMP-binding protein [Nitrosopumilaceae archaeon]